MSFIENQVEKLKKILPGSSELYISDDTGALATERLLHVIIESLLDICIQLVKYKKLGLPKSDFNSLDLLSSTLETIEIIKKMKKFRNVLVHQYADLDNLRIYEYAQKIILDIPLILTDIRKEL